MEPNRARMLESAPLLANLAVSAAQDRQGGQGGLFAEAEPALRPVLPKTRAWNGQQKLDQEFKSIGFYFSGHPLDDVLEGLDRERVTLAMEVQDRASDGKPLEMIGVVRARSDKPARNGGKFAFLTLSDPSGEVEMMVFPETLSQNYDLLQVGNAVAITVGVKRNAEEIKLNAERVLKLEAARLSKAMGALKIRLAVGAYVGDLAGVVGHLAKLQDLEQGELLIEMPLEDGRVVTMKLPATYTIGLSAQRALKEAPGVERVEPLKAA